MKIKILKNIMLTIIMTISLILTATSINAVNNEITGTTNFDPLSEELEVTVQILSIRSLEDFDRQILAIKQFDRMDRFNIPDFYLKIFINEVEFKSDIWRNTKYVDDPGYKATLAVPNDEEFVEIKIQLWDRNLGFDRLCDISSIHEEGYRDSRDVELTYSIKSGHWYGDDFISSGIWSSDISGYGRLNGCDDGSVYQNDRDCEVLFDIYQTDPDGDRIPYWTEVSVYGTDPLVDNTGEDEDEDGIPIEWEHKWGHFFWRDWETGEIHHGWNYHPFEWNDHANIDVDEDGLNNIEEYLTSQWGSDPFRRDIFLEVDQMETAPNNGLSTIPDLSWDLMMDPFARQNIVLHIDHGDMGGGEILPYDQNTSGEELQQLYLNYFMEGDPNYWRRGAFHYGLIVVHCDDYPGFVFSSEINESWALDCFQVSSDYHETRVRAYPFFDFISRKTFNKEKQRAIIYAAAMVHETGHTLGIFNGNTPGCDDRTGANPLQINWWKWHNYKSVMNYGYCYSILIDYSDGSNGKNDFDDWGRLDLSLFQIIRY